MTDAERPGRAVGPVVEGEMRCEILTRLQQPLLEGHDQEGRDIVGYRCMKIAARTAPVRLRIVDKRGAPAPATGKEGR